MGKTLVEAVESVVSQSYENWEVIIVNDGSTDMDVETIGIEIAKKDDRISYFQKENGGLGSARNYGLRKSTGEYVILLDADNRLKDSCMKIATSAIEENRDRLILYGDAEYIGARKGIWRMGPFDKLKLLKDNYIDACAVIQRELIMQIGGYDESLPEQGHEDWDLWLSALEKGVRFYYLNQVVFDYRVRKNSMIRSMGREKMDRNIAYIREKHHQLYCQNYKPLYQEYERLQNEFGRRRYRIYDKVLNFFAK